MKHFTLTLSIAATALLTLPTLSLAADEKKPEGKRPGGPGGRFSPEERIKRMTETLGLSQEQQDKLKTIFGKGSDEMKALREKGRDNLTEEDKAKMKEFFTKQMEEVNAVLTPEQREKWKTEMEKRRSEGGGPGGRRPGGDKPGEKKPEAK
jgi:Spy/CpxP family protein refolding chaperone